jgi:YhgE/Pip-like protein
MPESHPQHAAPHPNQNIDAIRTVRFWGAPLAITLALMSALCALYLGGILNPTTNLRHFPIAVVNEDAGPGGAQIVDRLVNGLDKNKFDVRVVTLSEAKHQLDTGRVYGSVLIPPSFSSKLRDLATSAVMPSRADRPVITISTNPRAGTLGSSIAGQTLNTAMGIANGVAGERLLSEVAAQTGGAPLAGAAEVGLSAPIDIESTVYNPLPNGTGNGLSAFYYALLLLLAGFTGSIVVSTLVDALLGYVPAEFGPVYRFAEQVRISRFQTLLVKWVMMVLLALLTSAAYLAIAGGLGMPIDLGWQLWAFGVFAIAAVGITSSSLLSVLGTAGLLVSLLIFVILGLPSAGATVPLEATPPFFGWLAEFEPMHQVFLGARSLLYFKGHADTGLSEALTMTAIGLIIGLSLGGIVTHLYDRKGFHRIQGAAEMAVAAEHQAQHQARQGKTKPEAGFESSSEQT